MPLSTTPTASARDLSRFIADGYLVLPDLVATATIQALRAEADAVLSRLVDEMADSQTTNPRVTWWRLASGKPYVLKVKPVNDLSPAVAALADDESLRGLVTVLLGGPARLMDNKFMYKQVLDIGAGWAALPVLGEEVCKHTDAAYFSARGFDRVLTVAVCLDDCTASAGALRVWPGTHRHNVEMVSTDNQGPVVPDESAPNADAVILTASAGTVLVWDAALVHASGPNTSGGPRRLLVLGYAPIGLAP